MSTAPISAWASIRWRRPTRCEATSASTEPIVMMPKPPTWISSQDHQFAEHREPGDVGGAEPGDGRRGRRREQRVFETDVTRSIGGDR